MSPRKWIWVGTLVLTALVATLIARSVRDPAIRTVNQANLREYAGTYQWDRNAFLYLQMWAELAGTNQLVAFDETGELRTLYPTDPDHFFTGPGRGGPDFGRVAHCVSTRSQRQDRLVKLGARRRACTDRATG